MKKLIVYCISVFFLIQVLNAQNTGPVAPETMSFEPVDATDMVNLITGDYSYVIPLLNVMGPEGGYPLALSYHAGITLDQEASWVGLGWNITPGAINRSINGTSDDYENKRIFQIAWDNGDILKQWTVGVGVGINHLSVGLFYTWGQYKAFGGSVGYFSNGTSVGMSMDSKGNMGVNCSAYNFTASVNSNGGYELGYNMNGVGVSLGSEGFNYDYNPFGEFNFSGSSLSMKDYTIINSEFYCSFNVYYWFQVSIGCQTTTYWLANVKYDLNNGILYSSELSKDGATDNYFPMDVYSEPYSYRNFDDVDKSDKKNNLLLPAYDNYSVSAQGLAGSISPRMDEYGLLVGKSRNFDDDDEIKYCTSGLGLDIFQKSSSEIYFDFILSGNSFLRIDHGDGFEGTGNPESNIINTNYTRIDDLNGVNTCDENTGRKITGKYVEWFKNKQIVADETINFLETESIVDEDDNTSTKPRSEQDYFDKDGIGGYQITTEDGKTYHFSLPVYQFESVRTIKSTSDNDFQYFIDPNKYAYTWLITAITGPDYFDKNNNNLPDDGDYGYWVRFEYGKWTDSYIWRLPNNEKEVTQNGKTYLVDNFGRKQIYYLDEIITPSHTAYFIKSLREDGKSNWMELNGKAFNFSRTGEALTYWEDDQYFVESDPNLKTNASSENDFFVGRETFSAYYELSSIPQYVLKLDKIIIVSHDEATLNTINTVDLIATKNANCGSFHMSHKYEDLFCWLDGEGHPVNFLPYPFSCGQTAVDAFMTNSPNFYTHYQDNVLDIKDVPDNYESKAIRVIRFNYDYDLCKSYPSSDDGKLTLTSVEIDGNKGYSYMPPYQFSYNTGYNYNSGMMDSWGYYKSNPEAWSLNSIKTPLGGNINIEYESDKYITEAVFPGIFLTNSGYTFLGESGVSGPYRIIGIEFTIGQEINMQKLCPSGQEYLLIGNVGIEAIEFSEQCIPKLVEFIYNCIPINVDYNTRKIRFLVQVASDKEICSLGDVSLIAPKCNEGKNGGGLRVKKVALSDGINTYKSEYEYLDENGNCSGVTTFSLDNIDKKYVPYIHEILAPGVFYGQVTVKNASSNNDADFKSIYTFSTPQESESSPLYYDFQMGNQLKIVNNQFQVFINNKYGEYNNLPIYARHVDIINNNSSIGQLKSVTVATIDDDVISKTEYKYSNEDPEENINTLGVHQESYAYLKLISGDDDYEFPNGSWSRDYSGYYLNSSSRITIPNVLTEINTMQNNTITKTIFSDYDLITGIPKETKEISVNATIINKIIPAYTINAYTGSEQLAGMGSKVINKDNKNMLSQQAASITYKKINGVDNVINASIQTWNGDWNNYMEWDATNQKFTGTGTDPIDIWRKHKTFAWNGDVDENGAYGSDFDPYASLTNLRNNWNSYFGGEGISKWIKTSEVVRYDHYSSPVEVKDLNGNYASVKKDGHSAYTIATAALASYASFTATGFEDMAQLGNTSSTYYNLGGEVVATISSSAKRLKTDEENGFKAHTGEYMFKLAANATGPKYKAFANQGLQTGIKYRASVWVHKNSAGTGSITAKANGTAISGAVSTSEGPYGDWKLLNTDFNVAAGINDIEISLSASGGNVYFDDFRVSPYKAAMSAYTYDNAGNVTAILDNNNHAVRYTYDKAGRLVQTERETEAGFKKTSTHQYNYSGILSVTPNTPKSTSNAGTEILTYDVLNSSGITYTLQLPSWIDQISKTATSFSVKPEANLTCSQRSGNITVSVPQVGAETIQVVQEEAPAYHSIQVKSGSSVPENNILYTGNTYHVFFEYCDPVSYVDVWLYQYSSPTSTTKDCGHRIVDNKPLSQVYTTYDGFILTIGETPPSGCPSWNDGAYYRVDIQNHNDPFYHVESGNFRILHPPNPPAPPAYLHFTQEPSTTFTINPTPAGSNSYQYLMHWDYTDPQYDYLTFTLEICRDETAYPCIKEINLPPQSDAYYHTLSQLRQLTWSFTEGEIVDAIKNVMPVAYRADHYIYRIIAKKYGCTSNCPSPAYSRYFFISGLSITWP